MPSNWINISTAGITAMTKAVEDIHRRQIPYATARALNDAAKAASVKLDAEMAGTIFTKATPFTRRAVIAPPSLQARKDYLAAVVTVRPIQAKYLEHEDDGGTRTPPQNTRKPGAAALVLPGPAMKLNAYGNIPSGRIAKLMAQIGQTAKKEITGDRSVKAIAAAGIHPGKQSKPATPRDSGAFYIGPGGRGGLLGGIYQRLQGHRVSKLVSFAASASYMPKFNFHTRVGEAAAPVFMPALRARLAEAIASAK